MDTLFVSTYNILFGSNPKVFDSIAKLHDFGKIKSDNVIMALQEVRNRKSIDNIEVEIEKRIGDLRTKYFLSERPSVNDLGLATASNLKLCDYSNVKLPKLSKSPKYFQSYFLQDMPQMGALVSLYRCSDLNVRVSNVHLDISGGMNHKMRQIGKVVEFMKNSPEKYEIILGDFNTNGLISFSRNIAINQIEEIREYLEDSFIVTDNGFEWSSDIDSCLNPEMPLSGVISKLPKLGLKFRQRPDWILVKGFKVVESGVLKEVYGSDHYPVWAKLKFTK